ncbi:MAG TPA: glycosyltransferase family 2 protein [Saprospiraceae bacterium]|nr:glycosyltransferase family 2 protein [Saprospiraceae bacterium]
MDISVVIPLLNEEESLPELEAWIHRVMTEHGFSYEVIMVDDGSTDNSWKIIEKMAAQNTAIQGVKFRRNYGKSAALHTGFQRTRGEVVITMDADLQDSPEEIPELYRLIKEEGYDLISGWKKERFDSFIKNKTSKFFNAVTRWVSGIPLHDFNCGLKAYRSEVVKSIEVYGEMHRYIPLLAKWAGFRRIGEKVVKHQARKYGTTKFGFERFINGFLDLMSIVFVGKFRKRPMHFFGTAGILVFGIGFLATAYLGLNKLLHIWRGERAQLIADNPFFYLALTCVLLGAQLFLAGYVAELVARNAPGRNQYEVEKRLDKTEG